MTRNEAILKILRAGHTAAIMAGTNAPKFRQDIVGALEALDVADYEITQALQTVWVNGR